MTKMANKLKKKKTKRQDAEAIESAVKFRTLRFWFSCVVCLLLAVSAAITLLVFVLFDVFGLFDIMGINTIFLILSLVVVCTVVGTILAAVTSKYILKRISRISNGMLRIAKGDFKVRVKVADKGKTVSEFGELEQSFNQMASDLDGIEFFRNDFINNFSHEFKTPIVSIRGFARQLRSENLSEEQRREYLDIIITQSERLSTMSANVLLLTKLENQQIVTDITEFYLDEQIRKAILLFEKEWTEKNIDLEVELEDIKYRFNEEMLSHVWINLFSNAIKFVGEGGKIYCTLRRGERGIEFCLKDDGIGMSEDVKERIFEKFYQGDGSHTAAGNGIGLNIVHRILTLAGGSIKVDSREGEGSRFTVVLPNK